MLRIFHISEQKEKVSDASQVFSSIAEATVEKFQRSQMMLYLYAQFIIWCVRLVIKTSVIIYSKIRRYPSLKDAIRYV